MAKSCPCGCGRKLGLTDRGIAKKFDAFGERLEFQHYYVNAVKDRATPEHIANAEAFIADGERIRASLLEVLHGADPRMVDRSELSSWHSNALRMETETKTSAYKVMKG